VNNFSCTGRVGGEPTVRQLNNGKDVASFSVAVDSGYGENKQTNWVKVSLFDKRSAVARYIKKGDLIGLSGEIRLATWTDKEGLEKTNLELTNPDVTLIGRVQKSEGSEPSGEDGFSTTPARRPAPPRAPTEDPFADNVPF
jgi:single-strand DNA-binding protein